LRTFSYFSLSAFAAERISGQRTSFALRLLQSEKSNSFHRLVLAIIAESMTWPPNLLPASARRGGRERIQGEQTGLACTL
jgi:hypothetical protein